jgi:hypothetical protein
MGASDFSAPDDLVFNGINGATGGYLSPPVKARQITEIAKGTLQDREHLRDLERRLQVSTSSRGVREGIDPQDLSQAGWGIIFALQDQEKIPAFREALGELLQMRREQAGERYREFTGPAAYRSGETKTEFLARHGVGPGPADPARMPYYLLIAADPEAIPYPFQYQLDVQYAVGRIYFEDLEGYAQYARSLVALEKGPPGLTRRAVFVGVQNEADQATRLSATRLVQPLAARMLELQSKSGWEVQALLGEGATKAALAELLGPAINPALLFTASHGMGFPQDDPRQLTHQGALLCQDWPGPQAWRDPIPQDFYFSAEDVASDAVLAGSMSFHFACYGAGTPHMDDYAQRTFQEAAPIAPHAFVARLPQRLLGHPKGGMAAVVGHVERAWGYSFQWEKTESQLAVFESTLQRIMGGFPIGYAMEYFNQRYADLSTLLSSELQGARFGKVVDELALAGMWTANNDARSYVILGDPAARLILAPLQGQAGGLSDLSRPVSPAADLQPAATGIAETEIDRLTRMLQSAQSESPGWAEGQYQLGIALSNMRVGDRQANLQAAVQAFQACAQFFTLERDREKWIDLQLRLAEQYAELFARSRNLAYANSAEQVCRTLIAASRIDRTSLAAAYQQLADLFSNLFEHDQQNNTAAQALAFYKQALNNLFKESNPFRWAMAHLSLARLEISLYRETHEESHRIEARQDLEDAQEIFAENVFPSYHAAVLALLGELD